MRRTALIFAIVLSIVVVAMVSVLIFAPRAEASPAGVVSLIGEGFAAVGPGYPESWRQTCGTSASLIRPPSGKAMLGYHCQTPLDGESGGDVLVSVGDSGLAAPAAATRTGPVYSAGGAWFGNLRSEYCRGASSVVVACRAIVAQR